MSRPECIFAGSSYSLSYMKTRRLLLLLSIAFIFSRCSSPNSVTSSGPSVLQVYNTLSGTGTFFTSEYQKSGSPTEALGKLEEWLRTQDGVGTVDDMDSAYAYITMKSGLVSTINVEELDANGIAIVRGGLPKGDGANLQAFGKRATNEIKNKKVLIYAPEYSSFYSSGELQKILDRFSSSGVGFDVTVLKDGQATPDQVNHFSEYGFVIIDTHGMPDRFKTGGVLQLSGLPVTEQNILDDIDHDESPGTSEKIKDQLLAFGKTFKVQGPKVDTQHLSFWVTSKLIRTTPSLSGTVVFGNMCYSGWILSQYTSPSTGKTYTIQNPIQPAFLSLNPITYYAYTRNVPPGASRVVPNEFAKAMEDSVVRRLCDDLDSTGIAHLSVDGLEHVDLDDPQNGLWGDLYLRQYGKKNYSYVGCPDSLVDDRDGHVYKTVCIGSQTWMAENLAYDLPGSICYDNDPNNCTTYGKLYSWPQIMQGASATNAYPSGVRGICPKGWHVPSAAEWDTLIRTLGGTQVAGGAMKAVSSLWKSPNTSATNSSGFSALPGGFWLGSQNNPFTNLGLTADFGTTTEVNQSPTPLEYNVTYWNSAASPGNISETIKLSCRCVEDK